MSDPKAQSAAGAATPKRKRNPTQNLGLAKRRIDEATVALRDHPDLRKQCEVLRAAVLDAWVAQEKRLPEAAS